MGRRGNGVEIREQSIRLFFVADGVRQKHTLMLNGKALPPTAANLKYANRLAVEIREKIKHGGTFSVAEYFPASGDTGEVLTVRTQLDDWLASQRIEASTRDGYNSAARFWKSTLGARPLRALRTSEILKALNTRPELTGKTVNNYVSVLREALELAVTDKLLPDNPVTQVKRAKHQKPPVDPFSLEEAEAIIADLYKRSPSVARYTEFKFFTGLRTSESFGLRWANVDLASNHVLISEGVVRGIEVGTTKTHRTREVQLNSRSRAALVATKAETFLAGEHVFQDPRAGTRWSDERAFRRSHWTPCLKRLGIRYRTPYTTRHTYATMMLMAGMRPAFCAGQMGHSVEMFLRTYAKWLPGAGDAAEMAKLESSITSESSLEVPRKSPKAPKSLI
jgi:integrase